MFDALTHLIERSDPGEFFGLMIPLIVVSGGIVIAIVSVVTSHVRDNRKREIEATLKHEMIARGMSADEIERVLAARCETKIVK
jgi:siroheme synthase (precorrin-2 oxidase/ferrochelatase)